MSLSPPRAVANTLESDAAAFPILMRLPDLRSASETLAPSCPQPAALAEISTEPPREIVSEPTQALPAAMQPVATTTELAPIQVVSPPEPVATTLPTPAVVPQLEMPAPVAESPIETTVASVSLPMAAEAAEPVSPAVARRQRAQERLRRKETEQTTSKSWWTSHAPVIAIGFLLALMLTVYIARSQRESPAEQASATEAVPELNIDIGEPSSNASEVPTSSPSMLTAPTLSPPPELTSITPEMKSPPLLSAKPTAHDFVEVPTASDAVPRQDFVDARTNDNVAAAASEYEAAAAPDVASSNAPSGTEVSAGYPSTDPTAYRPGGRAARTARSTEPAPEYPTTSAPNWR